MTRHILGPGMLALLLAWLLIVVVCVLPSPPARDGQSPEPRALTVVPASPTVYQFSPERKP